ncbi:hypothetical protein BC830DRAFT_1094945 [Chytriomyces sp. MP71]|nr:hypothetical protein BC830DRAFT_1094945 [Chytriomyces sp. MP71]
MSELLLERVRLATSKPPSETGVGPAQAVIEEAVDESVGLVVSRVVVSAFVDAFTRSCDLDNEAQTNAAMKVWRFALAQLASRSVAFEEQISAIRFKLADILEHNEDWTEAAKVLMGIPLDSGHRQVDNLVKLDVYVRIVRLLLEDEDSVAAESYLNRASLLVNLNEINLSEEAKRLHLLFRASQARLLDFKRQFQLAAQKYLSLSYTSLMAESEKTVCLVQAVICAILAPAGPVRSRLLATLYKDDRVRENPDVCTLYYPILEKMYLDRILRPDEIAGFRDTLKAHQLAKLADGATVLDRAVMEHNVLAASRIYTAIHFSELSSLLGLGGDAAAAEGVVSRMVGESRVEGRIDQIEGLVYFETGNMVEGEGEDPMGKAIRGVCEQVDSVVEEVMKKNPDWVRAQMVY